MPAQAKNLKPLSCTIPDLERYAYARDYVNFRRCILEVCDYLNADGPLETRVIEVRDGTEIVQAVGLQPLKNTMSLADKFNWYTRLAAAITAYLSDPQYQHSNEELLYFILFKPAITNIFYCSAYESMDHILWNRGLMSENYRLNLKTDLDIKYLLCCYTLNSRIAVDHRMLYNVVDVLGPYSYLALLRSFRHPFTEQMSENHQRLLEASDILEKIQLDGSSFSLLCSPWMLCSYWDVPNRHELKGRFNNAIERWVEKLVTSETRNRINQYISKTTKIKRIVVASEKYIHRHAMYRCFHPALQALKEEYELILVSAPGDYDEVAQQDFHRTVEVSDEPDDVKRVIDTIAQLEPDLVLFPSLGMAKWTIACCNMRLAKFQVMGYGHPASAFSRFIDYGLSDTFPAGRDYQQFVLEKLVPVTGNRIVFEPHPEYTPKEYQKPNDGVVRIAINSSLQKVGRRLINLCAILLQHSTVPLEFHFFMIENRDAQTTALAKSLLKPLGDRCVVHNPQPYPAYMECLAQCDLAVGTYPFGGANTNVDVSLLGIPKVYLADGSDLAAFADEAILSLLNLNDVLRADSEGALLAILVYLVHNAPERKRLSQAILARNPYSLFFDYNEDRSDQQMLELIRWIESERSST